MYMHSIDLIWFSTLHRKQKGGINISTMRWSYRVINVTRVASLLFANDFALNKSKHRDLPLQGLRAGG
jgi:hypothetical protein